MWIDLLFAVALALLVSALLWAIAGWPGIGGEAAGIFLLVLLITWAIGAWVSPVGPGLFGGYWVAFVVPALLLLLLLAALTPNRPPRSREEVIEQARADEAVTDVALFTVGAMFWVLLIGLGVAIAVAYL